MALEKEKCQQKHGISITELWKISVETKSCQGQTQRKGTIHNMVMYYAGIYNVN